MVLEGGVLGVGFTCRPEVFDVLEGVTPLFARLPLGFDAHAHPYVRGITFENQVQERNVSPVEKHVGGHVGRFDSLPEERDVDDAEGGDNSLVGQFDLLARRLPVGGIRS